MRIAPLWDGISRAVGSDRMYTESGVEYTAPVTSVIVTEHQYIRGSEEKSLYEGTALEGDVITFSEPMHSLTADGFAILAQGANWAKLSAGTGVLRGNTYIHNTREVVWSVSSAAEPNVKKITDAALISLVNSTAVANRLANYYRLCETVNAPVVYRGELPGDRIASFHPFDRVGADYCLQSVDVTMSNTLKAQAKGLVGFAPEQIEDIETYDYREVLIGSGEWEVPEDVEEVVAVLISGGDGGKNGEGVDGISVSVNQDVFGDTKYFNLVNNTSASGSANTTSQSGGLNDMKGKRAPGESPAFPGVVCHRACTDDSYGPKSVLAARKPPGRLV